MKDKSFNDGTFLLVIGFTLMFIFLCCLTCSAQQYYRFNDRSGQEGHFYVKIEGDSISISESFRYTDGLFTSTFYNSWNEYITNVHCGQMCMDIFTESAQWVLFYCEEDNQITSEICEMYYRPHVGETLHYQNLLK